MFNIGPSEMFLLGILFLFLFGPEKLPEVARAFGQALAAFREHSRTVTDELKRQLEAETSVSRDLVRMQEPERQLDEFYEDASPSQSQPMGAIVNETVAPAVGEAAPLPVLAEPIPVPAVVTETPEVPAVVAEKPALPAIAAEAPVQAQSTGDGFLAPSELQGVKRQRWSISASNETVGETPA